MTEKEKNQEEIEEENIETNEEVTVADLMKETEKLKQENEKYYEHLQRTAAEFDNYKKRMQKEKEATYNLAVGDVVTNYLEVLDELDKLIEEHYRMQKEKEATYNLAVGDVVTNYLEVLDNLEKASLVETTDEKTKEGIELIKKQMTDLMTKLM